MTSYEFLKKYLEYKCYWTVFWGTNNKSAKIREKQMLSIMKAFKIYVPNNKRSDDFISDFENGLFLKHSESNNNYEELIKKVIKFADEFPLSRFFSDKAIRVDISYQQIFSELLKFRIKIDSLKTPTKIRYEGLGNISEHFVAFQKGKIIESLESELSEIDKILCLLIDPSKKDFSIEELIQEYNYPKDDLKSIDLDWMSAAF